MPIGTKVGLGSGDIVLDGDPVPRWKGAQQSPTFWPVFVVARQSPISATAELLLLITGIIGVIIFFQFLKIFDSSIRCRCELLNKWVIFPWLKPLFQVFFSVLTWLGNKSGIRLIKAPLQPGQKILF